MVDQIITSHGLIYHSFPSFWFEIHVQSLSEFAYESMKRQSQSIMAEIQPISSETAASIRTVTLYKLKQFRSGTCRRYTDVLFRSGPSRTGVAWYRQHVIVGDNLWR